MPCSRYTAGVKKGTVRSRTASGQNVVGLVQMTCDAEPEKNLKKAIARIGEAAKRRRDDRLPAGALPLAVLLPDRGHGALRAGRADPGPDDARRSPRSPRQHKVVIVASLFERRAAGRLPQHRGRSSTRRLDRGPVPQDAHPRRPALLREVLLHARATSASSAHDTRAGKVGVLVCWDQWYPEARAAHGARGRADPLLPDGDRLAARARAGDEPRAARGLGDDAARARDRQRRVRRRGQPRRARRAAHVLGPVVRRRSRSAASSRKASATSEEILLVECDLAQIEQTRQNWPFLRDRRIDAYGGLTARLLDVPTDARDPAHVRTIAPDARRARLPQAGGVASARGDLALVAEGPGDVARSRAAGRDDLPAHDRALAEHETVNLLVDDEATDATVRARCRGRRRARRAHDPRHPDRRLVDPRLRPELPPAARAPAAGVATPIAAAYNDWGFNAWGGKYADADARRRRAARARADRSASPRFEPGLVLEGGSIDVNGAGIVLTTEQCLLNPNRNPQPIAAPRSSARCATTSASRRCSGSARASRATTPTATSTTSRASSPRTRSSRAVEDDPADANHAPLHDNLRRLALARDPDGRRSRWSTLPMPGRVARRRRAACRRATRTSTSPTASCCCPSSATPTTRARRRSCAGLFPERRVVPIRCEAARLGHGRDPLRHAAAAEGRGVSRFAACPRPVVCHCLAQALGRSIAPRSPARRGRR